MGYLFHILIALGAEALGELGFVVGWQAPWALALLLPVPHLLAWVGQRALACGNFTRAALLARAVHHAPPLQQLVLVCVFGWVQSTQAWTHDVTGVFAWPRPALLLAFAPFLLFEVLAIDAQARLHDTRPRERRLVRTFQLRMFFSALLPLLLYFGLSGLVAASDAVRVHVEHVALFNALFTVVLIGVMAVALPILVRNTWETVPLPEGPQRRVLEEVARRADFRARALLVWRTGNLMTNAAIVGVTPRSRVVLFSDSLLAILSLRELAAVFAHEMGHALRHHVWIFIAWALAFFMAADLATQALAESGADGMWWSSAALALVVLAWAVSFGWMSRRFELEADLFSLELLEDPDGLILALERVGSRDRDKGGWRHFSTRRRVDFLLRAAHDRGWAARFRARLRRLAIAGAVLAAVTLALELRGLLASYPADRVWAELSLGRFASAAERAEDAADAGADLDEDLLALARFAGGLTGGAGGTDGPGDPVDAPVPYPVEDLEGALEGALEAGDLGRASGLAELAVLRGAGELVPVARAIRALSEDDPDAAREHLAASSERWRTALGRWVAPQ